MEIEVYKTFQGYEVAKPRKANPDLHDYVAGVYRGQVRWTCDYLYSKKYKTLDAAKRVANRIATGEYK